MKKLHLKIFDLLISIELDNIPVLIDILNTFSYFCVSNDNEKPDISIRVAKESKDNYCILYNDKKSSCASVNLYPKLCEIIRRSIIFKTTYLCFHAAAVEKDGKAFVFISTGNSGKSTLCTALTFNGFRLISDDTCWLDTTTGIVYPYPLAIGVRQNTLSILPALENFVVQTSFPGKLIMPIEKNGLQIQQMFLHSLNGNLISWKMILKSNESIEKS